MIPILMFKPKLTGLLRKNIITDAEQALILTGGVVIVSSAAVEMAKTVIRK